MNRARRGISDSQLLGLLFGVVIFAAAVQALAIGLSLLAIPLGRLAAIGILGISAVFGWMAWRSETQRNGEVLTGSRIPEEDDSESSGILPWIVLAFAAVSFVAMLALSIIGNDFTCDGNAYHIPTIHAYLLHQRVCWIEEPFVDAVYMNGYPKGAELFAMILVQALHPALLGTVNVLFLPLGVLGVAYLARAMGASALLAMTVGAAWAILPVNVCQIGTTYVDSSYASCVAAFLAILFSVMRGRLPSAATRRPSWWMSTIALGCSLGMVIAVKSSGIAIGALGMAGLAVFFLLAARAVNRHVRWTRNARDFVAFFGVALVTGAAVGGYWYARNWVWKGSPLYPVGVVVMGHPLFPGVSVTQAIGGVNNTPPELRDIPIWMAVCRTWLQIGPLDRPWFCTVVGLDSRLGGLGHLWIAGCLPATCWLLVRALRTRRLDSAPTVFLVAICAAAFVLQPLCWWARYTVWIHAIGLPAFAVAASRGLGRVISPTETRSRAGVVRHWVTCCCAVLLIEGALSVGYATSNCLRLSKRQLLASPVETFTQIWHADLQSRCPFKFEDTPMSGFLSDKRPVACGPLSSRMPKPIGRWKSELVGWLCRPVGQRRVYALSCNCSRAEILKIWDDGVRDVVWDDTVPVPETLRAASERVERTPGLIVFTLRPPSNEQP